MRDGGTNRPWVVCFFALLLACTLQAQDVSNAQVTVYRSDNGELLSDAIVKVTPIKGEPHRKFTAGLTDVNGIYRYRFTEPSQILISYLGFTTLIDTVFTATEKNYRLIPVSQSIQDVVVTGQYGANSVQKSVYEVKVITQEVMKAKGANNLREALQNELNIDLGQDQVFGSSMGINGISGEGVKIMVDGVPIVGRLDGKLDLSQININNIERIEIVEGPLSVMYGTDAMGGVINIITKNFQTEKVNLNLKAYYETVGQYNIELNSGFSFKKNQLYLSGGRYFFDGFTTLDTVKRFMEWKPKEQYFADAKYVYNGNRLRFSVLGSFFREVLLNRSAPKQTLSYANNDTAWTYSGDDTRFLTYRPRVSASFMYRFKEAYQLDALLAYSGFIRFTNNYTKDLVNGTEKLVPDAGVQDTTFYHHILFRSTYSMPAWKNRINFLFGLEANQEFTRQTRIEGGQKQVGDYAAFSSIRISIIEGLDVQPAIRIIYNTLFRAPLVPSINVKYGWKDRVIVRASYGVGYRAPSLKELYLEFFDSNHSLRGNPNLIAENGQTANLSLNYTQPIAKTHSLTFSISGFYNHIKNKIDWRIIPSIGPELDTFQYFNIKDYRTYGGDAGITYRWKRLTLNASAMATGYRLNNSGGSDNGTQLWSPDVTAGGSYTIPKAEVGVNVFYKYNGVKPIFSVNNSVQTGTRNAFHMLDVSLTRSFWKNRIQLTIGGKNLVGVTNIAANGVNGVGHNFNSSAVNMGWGRTFFTTLVLHFSK